MKVWEAEKKAHRCAELAEELDELEVDVVKEEGDSVVAKNLKDAADLLAEFADKLREMEVKE